MRAVWLGIVIVVISLWAQPVRPEAGKKFVIIVHKSNKLESLGSSKLELIYLRKVSRWPWGAEILPIDLPDRSPLRRAFAETVLERSLDDLSLYWIDQKVTRNVNPPIEVSSVAAIKALVASRAGAIAYIPPGNVDGTVKVLEEK